MRVRTEGARRFGGLLRVVAKPSECIAFLMSVGTQSREAETRFSLESPRSLSVCARCRLVLACSHVTSVTANAASALTKCREKRADEAKKSRKPAVLRAHCDYSSVTRDPRKG